MTLAEILQFISAACAVIGGGTAVIVARRAQRWRDTDEAKGLIDRVDECESRLDKLDTATSNLVTKQDLARVEGEVKGLCKQIDDQVVPGLNRIEGFFIAAGVDRVKP